MSNSTTKARKTYSEIRTRRLQRGLTQDQLAELCDVGQPCVVKWELYGAKPMKASTRRQLERALGAPLEHLLKTNGTASKDSAADDSEVSNSVRAS